MCGELDGEVVWVVSSTKKAYGLERAAQAGIESFVLRPKKFPTIEEADDYLLAQLQERRIDYIALAGYLRLIPENVVRAFPYRILNTHPALLPKYGGQGMYGHFVHEAVLASGDKESGPSIHLVDEIYDNGPVLEQTRVPVLEGDTPDALAARVLKEEHKLYPIVIDKLIKGKYEFDRK